MHDFCSVLHDGTMSPDNMLNYCLFLLKEETMAVVGIGETDVHSEFRMNKCEISWHFSSIEYQSRNFSQVTKINKELLF